MDMNFMDETDCANLFDQIDDLIEFPPETECDDGNMLNSDDGKDFPSMWNDPFPDTGHPFPVEQTELFVPYEDIVQLEWLSTFVDDSFSGGATPMEKDSGLSKEPLQNQFQTTSPVSVLESSSSSCSVGKMTHVSPSHPQTQRAPRSKRPRPTSFNPRTSVHELISPSSSFIEAPKPFLQFADSPPVRKAIKPAAGSEQKRKKKSKHTLPADAATVRKCLHCETTKTPQWRAGPMGPKTLCNACGVRHKSGRLLPEYRPAASPTFVSWLHSNSHKKVVEMRSKGSPKGGIATTSADSAPMDPKPLNYDESILNLMEG